jgi:DNA-binding winged helix-turn-helix (wHTH) protein/tetratricopeptide (TPR) repeat protein
MPAAGYRFGPFLVDRAGYRVLRGSDAVDLTPKLLDLLLHLLERPGTLVTKEERLEALWPGANVTENALAQAMSELRQALGDEAGSPQFIKTVARRGYRFIAPVENIEHLERVEAAGAGDRSIASPGKSEKSEVEHERTIAVMDFVNVTGDADSAWLSAGIAETVTGDLRSLGSFRVVDRRRVMEAARRTSGSLQQVAGDLRARLAVVGSFQRNGDRIRITARVVDVDSGEALADAKVDGPLDTIFALQDQVVAQFSADLGVASTAPTDGGPRRDTPSLDAFRAFSEASVRLESLDVREMPQAIADFERAAAADPRYALAYTGLAAAEFALYESTRWQNDPAVDLLHRAAEHARHAVQLDETLAEAHATLALVLVSSWQTNEAAPSARRAVALEPSNWRHLFRLGHATWGDERLRAAASTLALHPDFAFAYFQTAMLHVARGHLREAETVLRQGAAVQDRQIKRGGRYPALGLHWLLGLVRLAQDDVHEAIAELEREHALAEPHRLYGREYALYALHGMGAALLRARRIDEAIDRFRRALELYPQHGRSHIGLALALRAAGSTSAANAALEEADRALVTLAHMRPIEAALVQAERLAADGNADGAVAALRDLLDTAPAGFAGWTLPVEPFLRELHASQPFAAVLSRLTERAR